AVEEDQPTFYLAFDRSPEGEPVSLAFALPPRQFVERLVGQASSLPSSPLTPNSSPPRGEGSKSGLPPRPGGPLTSGYLNGRGWAERLVVDETRGLTRSGRVKFLGPPDLAPLARFQHPPAFWVRVRLDTPGASPSARLSGVWLNAVPAVQGTTVRNEVVGS